MIDLIIQVRIIRGNRATDLTSADAVFKTAVATGLRRLPVLLTWLRQVEMHSWDADGGLITPEDVCRDDDQFIRVRRDTP